MKLALKLTLAIWLGIVMVLAVNAYTRFLRESRLFETDMARDHGVMGRGIAAAISTVWEDEGRERALDVVERVNRKESDILIRFVEMGAQAPLSLRPSAPPEIAGRVRRGTIETWIDRSEDGRLYTYVPILVPEGSVGAVELSETLAAERAYIRTSMVRLVITTAGMALVAGLISIVIGLLMVGRPVRALAERARSIGEGDFRKGSLSNQRDELGYLGREIEGMAERLEQARTRVEEETRARMAALEQLRHAERVSTVGKLAAGVAHELGTPLNVIAWRTRRIQSGRVEGEEARENARIANEQVDRITRIVRQLLDFARQKAPESREVELVELVRQTVGLLEPSTSKARVNIKILAEGGPLLLRGDPSQLQQVFTNLLLNAIQAMAGGGEVSVTISRDRREPAPPLLCAVRRWARVCVEDHGPGISPQDLPHIFDPFFTTKKVGEGTGLGLSVAWGIIAEHRGWIEADSRPGEGARLTVFLPEEEP